MSQGLEVYGPDNSSVVWSSNIRASNIQVLSAFSLNASTPSQTFACADANDTSAVIINFFSDNAGAPVYGVRVTSRTATSFTIEKWPGYTVSNAYVIAVRIS